MENNTTTQSWNEAIEAAKTDLTRKRDEIWLGTELPDSRSVQNTTESVTILNQCIGKLDEVTESLTTLPEYDNPGFGVAEEFPDCHPKSYML